MVGAMTTTERPKLPPIVCAPWCEDGDGHAREFMREDQTCWGPESYVDLSRERVTRDGPGLRAADRCAALSAGAR